MNVYDMSIRKELANIVNISKTFFKTLSVFFKSLFVFEFLNTKKILKTLFICKVSLFNDFS